MSLVIRIRLAQTLDASSVSKNALAREAKVRPNLIYEMCEGKTRRVDLETLSNIITTLHRLTGKPHTLNDVLEYIPDNAE